MKKSYSLWSTGTTSKEGFALDGRDSSVRSSRSLNEFYSLGKELPIWREKSRHVHLADTKLEGT